MPDRPLLMDRRTFIRLTAVSGATTAVGACSVPSESLIRFVPDEDVVPGLSVWTPGVCTLCGAGCGLTVRLMDADADVLRDGQKGVKRTLAAKKLEGHAEHPVNHGRLCARGQAGIQVTYHPDRITQPLKRAGERGTGRYEAIDWEEALADLAKRLDAVRATARPGRLAWFGRAGAGHRDALVLAFVRRLGGSGPIAFDVFGDEVLRRANAQSFGRHQLPTLDLVQARYVISCGADFLGTWNSPVAHSLGYGAMRQGRRGIRGAFVQVESRMTQTGANADEWLPANPGTEGALALGLAHVIMARGAARAGVAGRAGAQIEECADGLPSFNPEAVSGLTGVSAKRIERLATELIDNRPSVVIVSGPPLAHTNGLFTALAVNALNALIGAVEQPSGLFFTPQANVAAMAKLDAIGQAPADILPMHAFVAERLADAASTPELLIVDGANPVFSAPPAWRLRASLLRVPTIVSVGAFLDETSALADLILPDHSFLESWTDAMPESGASTGVISVAAPAMRPLHNTKSTVDVLREVSAKLQPPLEWPWQTHEEFLMASIGTLPPTEKDGDGWSEVQMRGGWWGDLPPTLRRASSLSDETSGGSRAGSARGAAVPSPRQLERFTTPQFDGDSTAFPLYFLPAVSPVFLDGSLAHLPWLQELPDPLTSAMWSAWVELNPDTAQGLGIRDGDVVRVTSAHGWVEAAAILSLGIAPTLVAMPAGQGHTTYTRYASGRGANPFTILAAVTEETTGALAWAATRVKIEHVSGPDGRLVLFAGGQRAHGASDYPPHR